MADSRKRFTIKAFRTHQPMSRNDAGQTWDVLANAIDEIYNRNASQLSFEELYRNAYNLVLHKHGAILYEGVTAKINSHLLQTVQHLEDTPADSLLEEMATVWRDHLTTMVMIRDILMYMDRTYVPQQKRRPVYELGLHLFRVTVWEHPAVSKRVMELWLLAIQQERLYGVGATGSTPEESRAKLRAVVSMLLELGRADYTTTSTTTTAGSTTGIGNGTSIYHHPHSARFHQEASFNHNQNMLPAVYQQDLEMTFLGTTQEFYHAESLEYLSRNTASDYVRKATARMEEEKERSAALGLPATTEAPLNSIVQTELIERHAVTLVEMEATGFAALLRQYQSTAGSAAAATVSTETTTSKLNEMLQMYDLFARVPSSVDHLRDALAERIKQDGRSLTHDQVLGIADPPAFVRGVLAMRQKYCTIVEHAFRNEKKAQKRVRESFEDFLNVDARAASCLAMYVDELLRQGLRGSTEDVVQEELNKVITVFRYLSDKDVFESFYKQHLAKRLLGARSASDDAERAMVSLLKAECGYQFTTKLEGMFNDMRISRETREKYKAYRRQQQQQSQVDIEVDVLTTGYWPSQNVPACTLPTQVQDAIDFFSKFYLEKHTGRKLSWQTSAGAAELRACFGKGPNYHRHELCVSTYQMCILLLFNNQDKLTLGQIRTHTHIPDQELRRHLISLCTPKNRILKKGSKGRGITSDDDTFTFNVDYTSKLKRVKIPLVKEASIRPDAIAGDGTMPGGRPGGASTLTAAAAAAAGMGHASLAGTVGTGGAGAGGSTVIDGSVPVAVEEDRRHLVEAAIVRIMKARKAASHNDLIAEVTRQLSVRFQPSPVFIKKRIESLIEREYLERSETEHRVYMYVA